MLCYRPEATLPKARKLRPTKPLPRMNTTHPSCKHSVVNKKALLHSPVTTKLAHTSLRYSHCIAVIFHPWISSSPPCLAFPNNCSIHTRLQNLSIHSYHRISYSSAVAGQTSSNPAACFFLFSSLRTRLSFIILLSFPRLFSYRTTLVTSLHCAFQATEDLIYIQHRVTTAARLRTTSSNSAHHAPPPSS